MVCAKNSRFHYFFMTFGRKTINSETWGVAGENRARRWIGRAIYGIAGAKYSLFHTFSGIKSIEPSMELQVQNIAFFITFEALNR